MSSPNTPENPSHTTVVGAAVASVLEGFAREALVTGTVIFSVIAAVGGLLSHDAAWTVAGLVVGCGGLVSAGLALGRTWSVRRTWTVVTIALLADIAVMFGLWSGASS